MASRVTQWLRIRLPMQEKQETWIVSLEDPSWRRKMATHSSVLAWRILWTDEPGGLHGGHKARHDRACIERQTDRWRPYQKGSTQFWQVSKTVCYLLCCPMKQKTVLILDWEVITKDIFSPRAKSFFFFLSNETYVCSTGKYSRLCTFEEKQKSWRVAKAVTGNFLPKEAQ